MVLLNCRNFLFVTSCVCAIALTSTRPAEANTIDPGPNYNLEYNPDTGNVTLVTDGTMILYVLESTGTPFITANHIHTWVSLTDLGGGVVFATGVKASLPNQVYEATHPDFALGPVEGLPQAGSYDIGHILPPGLTLSELQTAIDKHAIYTVQPGTAAQTFDFLIVPEPTSLALLGLGVSALIRRRRRR